MRRRSYRRLQLLPLEPWGLPVLPVPPGGIGPEDINSPAVPIGQQERPQRTADRVESLRFVPEAQKDVLDDLFGGAGGAENPTGQGEDGPGVTAVHLSQRILVPPADRYGEGRVAGLCQGTAHFILLFGAALVLDHPTRPGEPTKPATNGAA